MCNGETVVPPGAIGPPHPAPHATISMSGAAARMRFRRLATAVHGSRLGVEMRSRTTIDPFSRTTAAANFVPPMSTATTPRWRGSSVGATGDTRARLANRPGDVLDSRATDGAGNQSTQTLTFNRLMPIRSFGG